MRPDKRTALLAGALVVFGRDGFAGASIDAIASEAGVSTRTIYNHFADKAALFHAIVIESTTAMAAFQIDIIRRHFRKVVDVEKTLIGFGLEIARPRPEHAHHLGLVRHLHSDTENLDARTISGWREAGPKRVIGELAEHLDDLAGRDMLAIRDPTWAATHLMLLVGGAIPLHTIRAARKEQALKVAVEAGVHAFLHGYGPDK